MKITESSLRRIIKEEVTKKLDEILGDLTVPYDAEALTKAGLLGPTGKPRPRKERPIFLEPHEISDEAKRIAYELENSQDFRVLVGQEPQKNVPGIVQRVLDMLKSKGIGITEE